MRKCGRAAVAMGLEKRPLLLVAIVYLPAPDATTIVEPSHGSNKCSARHAGSAVAASSSSRAAPATMAAPAAGALFKPFRALGYITEDVPFAVQRRGKETYATVSVGRTWQHNPQRVRYQHNPQRIYNTAKLTLVMVGPQLPRSVSALACKGDVTFAAAGGVIHEAKRSHPTGCYAGHRDHIVQLLVLGDRLLSLGKDAQLLVWKIGQHGAPEAAIDLGQHDLQEPTCCVHPDTYVNKVLVGGADGSLQLWNFATQERIFTFKGWGCPVKCLAASPALDVVAVGLADGRVVLHNIRFDEELCTLHNAAAAGTAAERFLTGSKAALAAAAASPAVTSLAFRTGAGLPLLAVGGSAGVVALWNLEQRCLHHVLRDAHDGALTALHFFAGEPRLMSAAADNSLKQWVLDGQDAVPRLLKFRSGHSAPPVVVRHYADGLRLLSAGADRSFRLFSTIQDQQSRELSQKHAAARAKRARVSQQEIKLPRVVQLAASEARERDWANVITAHAGDPAAYTWRLAQFTLGEHALLPPDDGVGAQPAGQQQQQQQRAAAVSAVAISACGNFGLVGSEAGRVDRYNLQSGLHRGTYARQHAAGLLPAHGDLVTGLASDATNKLLVSAGNDAALRVWDFRRLKLAAELPLGAAATHLVLHGGSCLAAVACVDRVIRVVDVEAARVVRRFSGHSDRLTDLAISADCRWLLSSSMDCTLRVWDVPASQCLQVMHMGTPVTSLSLSANQDLLATSHINKRGVFLWSNQLMFGDPSVVATYTERPVPVHLPTIAAVGGGDDDGRQQRRRGGQQPAAAGVSVAKAHGKQQRSKGDGSDSDSDAAGGGSDSGTDEEEAGGLLPGREVRLLVDGGVMSDSSSDFFAADSESSDDDGGSDGGSGSDSDAADASRQQQQQAPGQQSAKKRRRAARAAAAVSAANAAAVAQAAYRQVDASGAPAPLAPTLATLSLLPRSQWENLLHLDTIAARSKPLQPPKKPEAAPFFLPTVPTHAGQPMFDTAAAAAAAAGEGSGEDADEDASGGGGSSRVMRSRKGVASAAAAPSAFVALLRSSAAAGDFAGLMAHVRSLSPAALDRELRAMVVLAPEAGVLDAAQEQEVRDVGLLLECLQAELDASRNFEMAQALLARVLTVHGDSLLAHPSLLPVAERLQRKLRPTWLRLSDLLQNVGCMVAFVSNAQG